MGEDILTKFERSFRETAEGACRCWRCTREADRMATQMVVCPNCGNKRCPKASDHRLACTNSNEPGQPGSVY